MGNEDYDDFYAYSELADPDWLPKVKVYSVITQEFIKEWAMYMKLCGQNVNARDMNSFFYKCPRTAMKRLTSRIEKTIK